MSDNIQLDKALILDRLGGDEVLFASLAVVFVEEAEDYCRNLQEALAAADFPRVQREAHTIKSLMATFADDVGTERALAIEQQTRLNRSPDLSVLQLKSEELVARVRLLSKALCDEFSIG